MLKNLAKALLYGALFFVCTPLVIALAALLLSVVPEGGLNNKAIIAAMTGMCAVVVFGLPKLLGDFIIRCWERKQEGLPIFEKKEKPDTSGKASIIRRDNHSKEVSVHKDQNDVCENYSSNMMQQAGWWKCNQCGRENASYTYSCACGNTKKKSG